MDYFFTPPEKIAGDRLTIVGKEFSHLTHVMRKRVEDDVIVVDGVGNAFVSRIERIRGGEADCAIIARSFRQNEPSRRLVLAVALLKNAGRFDFIIEKGTELGVAEFVPLCTRRTIPRSGKVERWRSIALAAMKQSCRSVLPAVSDVVGFDDFIRRPAKDSLRLIAHERAETGTRRGPVPVSNPETVVCIGPEGGFDEEEVRSALGLGYAPLYLGDRRLRTETAAVAAAAILLSEST